MPQALAQRGTSARSLSRICHGCGKAAGHSWNAGIPSLKSQPLTMEQFCEGGKEIICAGRPGQGSVCGQQHGSEAIKHSSWSETKQNKKLHSSVRINQNLPHLVEAMTWISCDSPAIRKCTQEVERKLSSCSAWRGLKLLFPLPGQCSVSSCCRLKDWACLCPGRDRSGGDMEESGSGLVVAGFVGRDQASPDGLSWEVEQRCQVLWLSLSTGKCLSCGFCAWKSWFLPVGVAPCQQVSWRSCVSLGALGESGTCSG